MTYIPFVLDVESGQMLKPGYHAVVEKAEIDCNEDLNEPAVFVENDKEKLMFVIKKDEEGTPYTLLIDVELQKELFDRFGIAYVDHEKINEDK